MSTRDQPARIPPGQATRIVLRPIASPFPLGFLGLASATLLLSGQQLGWFIPRDHTEVAVVMLAVGAALLLLASIFGFLARDTLAATGLGVTGATWLLIGLSTLLHSPQHADHPLGVYLLMAGVAVAIVALPAATMKVVPALVLLLTATRFLLTGVYQLTASDPVKDASAVVGWPATPSRATLPIRSLGSSANPACASSFDLHSDSEATIVSPRSRCSTP